MNEVLKVAVFGGLGQMSSPMAKHWKDKNFVEVVRVHDRGNSGEFRDKSRKAWKEYGAELVLGVEEAVGSGDIDGVFVCCGKNGDDLQLIAKIAKQLSQMQLSSGRQKFLCHMSTVTAGFASAAYTFCKNISIQYVNYPLTGGAIGAENGTMLILASGDEKLFNHLSPALQKLGNPKYFGKSPDAAAIVKLIGQILVFNGLIGICSATAVHAESFQNGVLGGAEQGEFFDFLNKGAGGTRQWDVMLSAGIKNDSWDAAFFIDYAVIDAIYAAKLCIEKKVSYLAIKPMIDVALAFSYVLNHVQRGLATHALVREMLATKTRELDNFIIKNSGSNSDLLQCLEKCIQSLPKEMQKKVALEISQTDFDGC